jgi:predicted kinase
MQLIIVQGQSGTGKTTMARRLAKELGYRTFIKDEYKETLFDDHGPGLGPVHAMGGIERRTWQAVFDTASQAIAADESLIIEGNFRGAQRRALKDRLKPNAHVTEVFCYARGWRPLIRYVRRNRSGERHAGHHDHLWYVFVFWDVVLANLGLRVFKPLRLSPATLEVDTSDFDKIDYGAILKYIRRNA